MIISLNSKPETKTLEEKCKILEIWDVLSRRWSLLILKNLSSKNVIRFNELKRSLNNISNTVLSDRLSELEQEGLITKKIYPQIPLKVEYRLTTKAKDLEPILQSLSKWCEKWELKK
ncbi:MAG TPA: helix-turn-helix domain-containing protein [Nitrososphaeraceae archaeon]|nr:helix-turn-helix domain-containing protein [Nitrososphaeraceae archaeon]HSL13450.1 helix-turn-helix domain-containing protein [Nitrososphaeraceae archaeon]